MNYLGHAYFSTSDTFLGNMAGDSMQGIDKEKLDRAVLQGLRLHYLIDRLTDADSGVRELRTCFSDSGLPYAGVLADLSLDYSLAVSWKDYSSRPWPEFREDVYRRLHNQQSRIPGRFQFSAQLLVLEDWFESYRSLEGMETAFYRLSRKTQKRIDIQGAVDVLARNESLISSAVISLIPFILGSDGVSEYCDEMLSKPCISL